MLIQKFFHRALAFFLSSIIACLFALCSTAALADQQPELASQVVKVVSPQLKLYGQKSQLGEGFMIIENQGKLPHTLVAVHAPAAEETVLHRSFFNEDGKLMMQQIRQIDLPPKDEATLQFGGLHIMLINIDKTIKSGTTIPIEIMFKDGSELTVTAKVV